jgi:hypothetical protein
MVFRLNCRAGLLSSRQRLFLSGRSLPRSTNSLNATPLLSAGIRAAFSAGYFVGMATFAAGILA